MIEAKNLVKRYGNNVALRGVSFTFEDGHIYGFLGPNGAGKSTTMNIITGCLAATDGEVKVNGYDIFDEAAAAKRCIGYLPEQPPLYNDMTVYEYLRYVGEAKGLRGTSLAEGVTGVMDRTNLVSVKDRLIKNLSKGFKQRVGIAQAILADPPIVILDEPTVGLDPKQIIEIRELIRELGEDHTVIISSHILTEISEICDYAVIISEGTVVASDTIDNLTTMFEGSVKIRLDARCSVKQAETVLSGVPEIRGFTVSQKGAGVVSAEIEAPKDRELRDSIFFAFADARVPIIALAHEEVSLEKVFLSLTSGSANAEVNSPDAVLESDEAEEYTSIFDTTDNGGEN